MLSTIPDSGRKLSYDCLKCVIQKLEVNLRFQIVKRLPSLNLVEKAAPLYISELSICEEGFHLNDTKYKLGVIRHALDGPNPEIIKDENRRGGTEKDIDRFGFEKYSLPELTPGDILIRDFYPEMELDNDLDSVQARVVESRKRLKILERHKMELEHASEKELENIPEYPVEREQDQFDRSREKRLERINDSILDMKRVLEYEEFDLQCYQCKRDNRPSPYDMFIQLTKTSPDETVYIERFNYDRSLKEARKYLVSKLLGSRRVVTKIKSLSFWASPDEGLVVGLPEGIKLDVQEFGTSGQLSEVLPRVEAILEHPNRPFARLDSNGLRLEDAQNPKVREAGILGLYGSLNVDLIIALCRELPNKKFVTTGGLAMRPRDCVMIVENLIDTKGTLGTCYEIRQSIELNAKEALKTIAERFENAVVGERLVTIPLPNQLQLDVSLAQDQFVSIISTHTIKMEVVQS
ncbi:unnamed protein product [Caenorhabditis nigoni]